jgi:adenosylcobinamide-phosphate synthase
MTWTCQILAAIGLDLLIGDPQGLPHPVRAIGWLAQRAETLGRRLAPPPRLAGILVALTVIAAAAGTAYLAVRLGRWVNPWLGDAASVVVIYTTIAAHDLAKHSGQVARALAEGDLPKARQRVAWIVGRDTQDLDEAEISRAAVESVAESVVDGVTAPLFFAFLAGPAGAMAYRAVNTLDSMFGHKDERYLHFGWASARIDDLANWLPARMTAPLMCLAATLLGYRGATAWRVMWSEARHHPSPNSGFPEAATAGALGVRLGGVNYYDGVATERPTIGQPLEPLGRQHIRRANRLMFATLFLFAAAGVAARLVVRRIWGF